MKEFSQMTCSALLHYVYELVDPRDNTVFYVGEGSNNRVFSHEIEARDSKEVQKAKVERINDIKSNGLSVKKIIVHSGMDAATAFECESALIDGLISAGVKLTNAISGHHSSLMDVYEAEFMFGAPILYSDDYPDYKFLVLNVTKQMNDNEDWRNNWRLNDKYLSSIDYVCFRYKKVIRKVFKVHGEPSEWSINEKGLHNFLGNDEDNDNILKNKVIYENEEHEKIAKVIGGEQWTRKYYNIK